MEFDISKAAELSLISKRSGQTEELVQAGGGNTSVKLDDEYMLIKSSGYLLSDVTERGGYSIADHRYIADTMSRSPEDSKEQEILAKALIEGPKPSIEVFLHSITKRYTIHTHPLSVTMLAASDEGMSRLCKMFPDSAAVGYATPGIKLAKEYYNALKGKTPDIVFLKNHGLIVSADTAEEALRLQDEVILKVGEALSLDTRGYKENMKLFDILHKADKDLIAYSLSSENILKAAKRSGGQWAHRFSPDCVVYCGKKFLCLSEGEDAGSGLERFISENGMPKVIVSGDNVYAVAQSVRKAREIESVLEFTAKLYLSSHSEGYDTLPEKEADFLLNWDSEKYRSAL